MGKTINGLGAFVVEALLTALLVLVVLLVTHANAAPGLAIGLILTVIHLVGIPLTGTSVNPARSIGPALFAGFEALSQLWLFIIAPLIGAALAVAVYTALSRGGTTAGAHATARDPTGAIVDPRSTYQQATPSC